MKSSSAHGSDSDVNATSMDSINKDRVKDRCIDLHLSLVATSLCRERSGLRGLVIGSRKSKFIGTLTRTKIVNGAPTERSKKVLIALSSQAAKDFLKLPVLNQKYYTLDGPECLLTLKANR